MKNSTLARITFPVALLVLSCVAASAQRGARTVPASLDQLVRESDTVIHGTVVSAKVEPHPQLKNLMTVVVTMNVAETLKGPAAKTLQFRQYIWDVRDQLDGANYRKGDELLLWRLSGMTAKLAREQAGGPIALTDLKEAIRTFSGTSR